MKIGIIGGGFMGLALAHKLKGAGKEIVVFEKEKQLGGLATYEDYGDFVWDRFYHVILPTDKALIRFLEEIGLEDQLRWKHTFTGFYVDKQFYSVSNSKEFLLFPPLNLIQKFRLGLTILMGSRIKDWRKMEKLTVEQWLIRYSGKTTYNKFWKPLLMAKLGESYKRVSAVFIWTYIKRLYEARGDSSAKKEQMGYVAGGYKAVFDELEKQLVGDGVNIRNETIVERIDGAAGGGIDITSNGTTQHFDKVIFTGPVNVLEKVSAPELIDITGNTSDVEYLGVVCVVLVLKKSLTPFYVLNIADDEAPFTGVIGMSTIVDPAETGGHQVIYLPKYIISDHPFLRKPDEEIKELFLNGMYKMYPELREEDIVSVHINRAFKVQPLQVINYSSIIPKLKTRHPDLFVLNTSQFVNNTLNNNSVAEHVNHFVSQFGRELQSASASDKKIQAI